MTGRDDERDTRRRSNVMASIAACELGDQNRVGLDYKELPNDVKRGVTLLLDDGRIVLERQFRYPVGERFWEFPQGAIDQAITQKQAKLKIGYDNGDIIGQLLFAYWRNEDIQRNPDCYLRDVAGNTNVAPITRTVRIDNNLHRILGETPEQMRQRGIDWRGGHRVTRIHDHALSFADQIPLAFDGCWIATGFSTDGLTWTKTWTGSGGGPALAGPGSAELVQREVPAARGP